jgi:hypothetical protein
MLAEMTASELAEWSAFAAVEPWGFREENRRVAVVASTIANMAGKKLRRPVKAEVFMPSEERETSPADVVEKVKALFGYGKGKR